MILVTSCTEPNITFSTPQPHSGRVLDFFPGTMRSDYSPVSDTTIIGSFNKVYELSSEPGYSINARNKVIISERAIMNQIKGSVTLDFKAIEDSAMKSHYPAVWLVDSLILEYYERPSYTHELISEKDSAFVYKVYLTDTMFYMSDKNVLKKYKKGLYANIQNAKGTWKVYQILLDKNSNLEFNSMTNADEEVFRRILQLNDEEYEGSVVSPSSKSFKQFLKMGGFDKKIGMKRE